MELAPTGKRFGIHQLVLLAFVGPCPKGYACRHLDGDPKNNHLSNLEWGTYTENNRDRIAHGTIPRGSKVNTSKLTEVKVREIRELLKIMGCKKIARMYGVRYNSIHAIKKRRSWAWLD